MKHCLVNVKERARSSAVTSVGRLAKEDASGELAPASGELTPARMTNEVHIGCRILGHLRVEQILESRTDSMICLADNEVHSELVLVVFDASPEGLAKQLSSIMAGTVIRRTTLGSWYVAEVELEESHLQHFASQLLSVSSVRSEGRSLPITRSAARARLEEGSLFAERYRIDGVLGRGGMGEVYRAYDATLDRAVALKVLRIDAPEGTADCNAAKRRFLNEARVVSTLDHPNIVEIHDAGESAGLPYMVLELCDGGNLRNAMAENPSQDDRWQWLIEMAEALAHAHDRAIIHRDVKPENILLTDTGCVKVADFGIAKALETAHSGENATLGMLGTPRYMAPEQLFGNKVDARADQFAWGLVAFEVLTGSHPRSTESEKPQARDSVATMPRIPAHLRRVVARAMASDPGARYADFHELLADLRRPRRRATWAFAVGAIAALAIGGAVILRAFSAGHMPLEALSSSIAATGNAPARPGDAIREIPSASPSASAQDADRERQHAP